MIYFTNSIPLFIAFRFESKVSGLLLVSFFIAFSILGKSTRFRLGIKAPRHTMFAILEFPSSFAISVAGISTIFISVLGFSIFASDELTIRTPPGFILDENFS